MERVAAAAPARPFGPRTARTPRRAALRSGAGLLNDFARYAGRRRLAITVGLIVAGAALEGVGILLLVPLLQAVLGGSQATGPLAGAIGSTGGMAALLAGFAAFVLARAAILTARDTQVAALQHGFVETEKKRLFERLARASWDQLVRLDRTRVVKALGSDMVQIAVAVHYALQAAVGAVLVAAYAGIAFVLAPGLSLLTLAFLAAVAMAGLALLRHAARSGEALVKQDLIMADNALRFLAGVKLAMAQGLQTGFLAGYARASTASLRNRVAFVGLMSAGRNLTALLDAIAAVAAILAGVLVLDLAPATLVGFILLMTRMAGPAAQVQQGAQQVAHSLAVFDELRALGAELEREDHPSPPRAVRFPRPRAGCAFVLEDISVEHVDKDGARRGGLRRISLSVGAGKFVGLSGHSGSGKSTLLDVIAGLVSPASGAIRVDGHPLIGALETHRQGLAYLGADPVLFGDTLRNNLLWAAPWADDAAMWLALCTTGADALAGRLGSGLDGWLEDAGGNLSAGERQRVALARALLRRPRLLLLDEATSSLDAASEGTVIGNIRALEFTPTILMVSHRAESLALCERVVTLVDGALLNDTALGRPRLVV